MKRILPLVFVFLSLAGCATSSRYVDYTDQRFPSKGKYYFITIYDALPPLSTQAFQVIGRVEVSGYVSYGVNPDTLTDEAKIIARQKGADAIINAKFGAIDYSGVEVIPGYIGRHHYRPAEYIPYNNTLLTFRGELVVFVPNAANEKNNEAPSRANPKRVDLTYSI